jgi:steroid delta-isomerase
MSTPQSRYRRYLENLTPETLGSIGEFVAEDVRFKDPFNDVRGIAHMTLVFRHMFDNVDDIRFTVDYMATDGDMCLMTWRFEGVLRGEAWCFDGASAVTFDRTGLVIEHIDHWDAARDFYERLPVIGRLLVWFRRRLAAR